MKKTMLILAVLGVVALSLGAAGLVYAQAQTPQGTGQGGPGPRSHGQEGPLHDYMVDAMADVLNLQPSELESRLSNGETFYQIALSQGLTANQIPDLMNQARDNALKAAVADGAITQEQADWMQQHGLMHNGFGPGNGSCHWNAQSGRGAPGGSFGPGSSGRQ
jgi:hypothetical protein